MSIQGSLAMLWAAFIGYGCGSIPFGVILFRYFGGGGDLRKMGSGNIGATNVLRTGKKILAAITLMCDLLKGTIAVLLVNAFISPELGMIAGVAAFLGHIFSMWLRFMGGKGVATYLGVTIALVWPAALGFAIIWLLTAYRTRYSSLAALVASLFSPLIAFRHSESSIGITLYFMTVVLWWTHRANISRLWAGTESRIGTKKK